MTIEDLAIEPLRFIGALAARGVRRGLERRVRDRGSGPVFRAVLPSCIRSVRSSIVLRRAHRPHGFARFTQAPRSALGDVLIEEHGDGERTLLHRIRSP